MRPRTGTRSAPLRAPETAARPPLWPPAAPVRPLRPSYGPVRPAYGRGPRRGGAGAPAGRPAGAPIAARTKGTDTPSHNGSIASLARVSDGTCHTEQSSEALE
ncbi:hypothetical protein GCM10020229_77410 [Kitasatospora albolonga]